MWEKKTQVQRRRADSESDDEVLYTDNTRGHLNDTKRERPPVRNMTLDEDALLDEVNLSESQARAIIEDLDLTVDDVSQEIEPVDHDEELERVEKDEIEDKSEDIGGHEIIIDESLSEDDPHEVTKFYVEIINKISRMLMHMLISWKRQTLSNLAMRRCLLNSVCLI